MNTEKISFPLLFPQFWFFGSVREQSSFSFPQPPLQPHIIYSIYTFLSSAEKFSWSESRFFKSINGSFKFSIDFSCSRWVEIRHQTLCRELSISPWAALMWSSSIESNEKIQDFSNFWIMKILSGIKVFAIWSIQAVLKF